MLQFSFAVSALLRAELDYLAQCNFYSLDKPTHPAILLLPDTDLRIVLFIPAKQAAANQRGLASREGLTSQSAPAFR